MIRNWIKKLGIYKTTILITFTATLSSVLLYLVLSYLLGGFSQAGIFRSALIPFIISPVLSFYFMKILLQLDQSEVALKSSEYKYKLLLNNIEDGYYEVDTAGRLIFCNDSLCQILGYSVDELQKMNYREILDKTQAFEIYKAYNQVFRTGTPTRGFDWEIINKDGNKRQIDVSISLIKNDYDSVTGFRGIVRDITARKKMEEELRESKERYKQIFNHAPAGIYEVDFIKGKLVSANDVLSEYTGYTKEELFSKSMYDLLTKESQIQFVDRIDRLFKGEQIPETIEYKVVAKDGREIWVLLNARYIYEDGKPVGATVVVHDIDARKKEQEEKKRLENQLRQAQKMEAIGTLAGGIAHDFNNILSAIMGYSEVALLKTSKDSAVKPYLNKVIKACNRAGDMVRQILAFSRQSDFERKPIQVAQIAKESIKMLSASLPSTIEINLDIESDAGIIDGDEIQIQQIIMNLCTNAAQAMKDKGGVLGVRLANVELSEKDVASHPELGPGSFLKLSISDTGGGISTEVMNRMFDPYYTTKPKGEGTGLGLSIVQGLVKTHNGILTVESDYGHSSVFHVYLPKILGEFTPQENQPLPIPGGNENILFVDDEASLVDVGKQILEHLGYNVTKQSKSLDAFSIFKSDPDRFDLVITDMTMPELTGDKLSEKILEIKPGLPIILCTGHSEHITEERAKEIGIQAFVMKPYLIYDLAKLIRKTLDANIS